MYPTPSNPLALADLLAAQQANHLFAFSLDDDSRLISRLRTVHAKKVAQLNAYNDLLAETSPDLILRTADGRELILRLPSKETISLCCTLREVLEHEIRKLEEHIIEGLTEQAQCGVDQDDIRSAILALCQPAPSIADSQLTSCSTVGATTGQAGQRPESLSTAA
jgi:hypothetical protein